MNFMIKNTIVILICFFLGISLSGKAQCANGDLEFGAFTNWNGYTGVNGPPAGFLNLPTFIPGFVTTPPPARHEITTAGTFDPLILGNVLPTVAEGNFALKLGNSGVNSEAEIASYTFTVTPATVNFSFQYAIVLQDPSHPAAENPFFSYWISTSNVLANSTAPGNVITSKQFIADASDPFYLTPESTTPDLIYKPWQTECFNLEGFIGQNVTVYFATADCNPGAHFGYAYIDGICAANNPIPKYTFPSIVCSHNSFYVNATKSLNYNDYYWKLERLSTNNIAAVIPGTDVTQTFLNTPITGGYDIESMYINGGQVLSNGYYKLTLGMRNCKGNWVENSVVVTVHVPEIEATNQYGCCANGSGGTTINMNAKITIPASFAAGTVMWYDESGNFLGNGTTTSSSNGVTTTLNNTIAVTGVTTFKKLRVLYMDPNGCSNEKWVYAVKIPDLYAMHITNIGCVSTACGPKKLRVSLRWEVDCATGWTQEWDDLIMQGFQFQWSNGATTRETETDASTANYSCVVTWPCGSNTLNINVSVNMFPGAPKTGSDLTYTTGVVYGSGHFRVYQAGMPFGTFTAYNAMWYKLKIYNRWGNLVYENQDYTCFGFYSGEISWDGVGNVGSHAGQTQPGNTTYTFLLELASCDYNTESSGTPAKQGNFTIVQ